MEDNIDFSNAAILIIDMQNDFVVPGAPIECTAARDALPFMETLVSVGHDCNIPIIFTQEVHRNDEVDFGLELEYGEPIHCLEGSKGVDFVDTLRPGSNDYIIR